MFLTKAKILINERIRIKADFYLMELAAPEIAATARPGQFMMISVAVGESPFLKRPMGINSIEALCGNRAMLRGIGLNEVELRVLGVKHAGE